MINKLIIYEKYELYFNYGIFTNQDYWLVDSIIKTFDYHFSSMYPAYKNYKLFNTILPFVFNDMGSIFERNKKLNIVRNSSFKRVKLHRSEENIDFYGNLLDSYNFANKREIIESFKMLTQEDFNKIKEFKNIEYYENQSDKLLFKEKSELVLFLITKNYYKSQLFDKHWIEAVIMKKRILIVFLESIMNFQEFNFEDHKLFVINDFISKSLKNENLYKYVYLFNFKEIVTVAFLELMTEVKRILGGATDYQKLKARKQVYLSYNENNKEVVKDFIDQINESNNILKCRSIRPIKDSEVFVIFNSGSLSKNIKNDYCFAKMENKTIFPIKINLNIQSNHDFISTEISEPINSVSNKEELIKFKKLFNRSLKNYNCLNNQIDIRLISTKRIGDIKLYDEFEIISSEEILVKFYHKQKYHLKLVDFKSGLILNEVCSSNENILFSWIQHLNQILIYFQINEELTLYNKNGNNALKLDEISPDQNIFIKTIQYDKSVKKLFFTVIKNYREPFLYIYDENFTFSSFKIKRFSQSLNLKVVNKLIFIWECDERFFHIYDLLFNFIKIIEIPFKIHQFTYDFSKKTNYVFIRTGNIIQVFNIQSFSFIGIIRVPILKLCDFKIVVIYDEKIVFSKSGSFFIFRISLNRNVHLKRLLASEFICELNPVRFHLYKYPYLLPCGNSACFDCILENYNLSSNTLKCNNEVCQEEHKFKNKLIKNLKISESIKENTHFLINKMINYGNSIIDNQKEDSIFMSFENRMSHIEQELEIRIESLFIELEKFEDNLIEEINFHEKKLLLSKKKFIKFQMDKIIINWIIGENIGILNNEFDEYFLDSKNDQIFCEKNETEEKLTKLLLLEIFK